MPRTTVLLADDHKMFLEGLQQILQQHCVLLGTVNDGQALLDAEARLRPQVIVTDISMPVLGGIEAARLLRRRGSRVKVIILSMHADREFATEALRAGARGYVLKLSAGEELLTAIQDVMDGKLYVAPAIARGELFAFEAAFREPEVQRDRLTVREREVLRLASEGKALKEIASELGVAVRTVVFHKSNMMEKLGLRTTAELTRYAVKHGMITV